MNVKFITEDLLGMRKFFGLVIPLLDRNWKGRTVAVLIIILASTVLLVAWIWTPTRPGTSYETKLEHQCNFEDRQGITGRSKSYTQIYLRQIMQDDSGKPSNLSMGSQKYSDQGQPKVILEYFKGKKNGTFIEAGANNGFVESNSLQLELEHGWRGLLVEPAPALYAQAVRSGRTAMFLEACISPKSYAYTATFTLPARIDQGWHTFSHLSDNTVGDPAFHLDKHLNQSKLQEITVDCYPLYDIMVAADLTKVDALMLDVQGPELDILKTLPWEHVDIKLIQVENNYVRMNKSREEKAFFSKTVAILEPRGYSFLKQVLRDYLFVKNTN